MSKELYNKIYSKINLEDVLKHYNVKYKQSYGKFGKQFRACCPFPGHDDTSPSFGIVNKTGVYNCYVCGGGNFFKFIEKMEKLPSTGAAIKFLKNKLGIQENSNDVNEQFEIIKNSIKKKNTCDDECDDNDDNDVELKEIELPQSEPAEKYYDIVKQRVDLKTIKSWKLRYCVNDSIYKGKCDGRLILPVYFEGKLVTFGGRDMTGKADKWNKMKDEAKKRNASKDEIEELRIKYEHKKIWYPFGAPLAKVIFNWDDAVKFKDYVMICEGILDCIKINQFGYNAVSILSCNLNDYKLKMLISNFDAIYVVMDNDKKEKGDGSFYNPGQIAASKIMEKLKDFEAYNVVLPVAKDPDKCTLEEFEQCIKDSRKF